MLVKRELEKMSTTLKVPYKRFTRRAQSGLLTNTQWLSAMASTSEYLRVAPWVKSEIAIAMFPVNTPSTPSFFSDVYDCFKQSGDAQSGTGSQRIFMGMSAYQLKIPTSASSTFISSILFRAGSDKFCVGGLKISAILSNSETPPTDWLLLRNGGAGVIADTTSTFATYGTMDEANETLGVLAETSNTISGSSGHVGSFLLNLSAVTTAYRYLYLVVSLFDHQTYRREYWVEGSGAIDGDSIEVVFNGVVTADSNMLTLVNEFTTEETFRASAFDSSYEIVNLTHSAGILYGSPFQSAQVGDLAMMRRIISMRNNDSITPRFRSPSGQDLMFGVCDDFSLIPGKIGTVYEKIEELDVYKLFGVTVMRGSETDGGIAGGISFDNEIPAFPVGQVVRFSFYGVSGVLPSVLMNDALIPQLSAFPHSITKDFVYGNATSFFLTVGHGGINSGAIVAATNPFSTITLIPLGHHDAYSEGLPASTVLPFKNHWTLPDHAVIVVTANVIKFTSDWVPVTQASTAVAWEPNDITLHLV